MSKILPPFLRYSVLACLLILATLFAGCETGGLFTQRTTKGHTPPPPPPPSLYEQAHAALDQKDYNKAELLAQRAVQEKKTPQPSVPSLFMVYAKAASMNKHPSVALAALENWRMSASGADSSALWQSLWFDAMSQLYPREGIARAQVILEDAKRMQQVHNLAYAYVAVRQWEAGTINDTLTQLNGRYAGASSATARALFEVALARELAAAKTTAISLVAGEVTPENQATFPYNIILIDQLRKQLENQATSAEATDALARLQGTLNLAEPALMGGVKPYPIPTLKRTTTHYAPIESGPITGRPVVLALPFSGHFSGISAKIAAGADVACKEMSETGIQTSLVIIDSDQPDWLARLEGLPREALIIGGPLRASDYSAAKNQGITSRRAFFAFMPSLDGADEGSTAWRFFTSANDQVRALTGLTSRLGITGYAAFYPDEPYGKRMTDLFGAQIGGANFQQASYAPQASASWVQAVGGLLSTNRNPESKASATFRAIFLPDSWKNMEVIIPAIHQFGETRQLLMGTTLWEQALTVKAPTSMQYYGYAVFPGAWDGTSSNVAKNKLNSGLSRTGKGQADFLTALGYDFARFAATTSLNSAAPFEVNSSLSRINMDWAIAPLYWENNGIAKQDLYLFTPAETGFMRLDEAEFASRYNSAWK